MANPNVIEYSLFSKPSTNTYQLTSNIHHFVREPDAEYGDDLITKITALLKLPTWPQFPDGAYLNSEQVNRLYQSAHGIQALIHILNRSVHLQGMAQNYNEPMPLLTEYQQSQLWAGLSELGKRLVELANEAQEGALENS